MHQLLQSVRFSYFLSIILNFDLQLDWSEVPASEMVLRSERAG
jgi:hypothetical protein